MSIRNFIFCAFALFVPLAVFAVSDNADYTKTEVVSDNFDMVDNAELNLEEGSADEFRRRWYRRGWYGRGWGGWRWPYYGGYGYSWPYYGYGYGYGWPYYSSFYW